MIAGSRWLSSAPLPKMRTPFHATLPRIDARFMENWGKIEPFIRYQKTKHSSDAKSKRHTLGALTLGVEVLQTHQSMQHS